MRQRFDKFAPAILLVGLAVTGLGAIANLVTAVIVVGEMIHWWDLL